MTDDLSDVDRADKAFRSALRSDHVDEVGVEPGGIRERLRRRRNRLGVVVAVAVALLALATVPLVRQVSRDTTAGDPTSRTPPAGWRIEQYRDVSLFVPDSWGYASAPTYDWCAESPDGQPLPEQRKPYVSLGVPNALAPARQREVTTPCPEQPESLLTEHVQLDAPTVWLSDSPSPTTERQGDWWVLVRIFHPDLDPTVIKVVSRNRSLADKIVDSAIVGGPCAATSAVQEDQRNPTSVDLSLFGHVDRAVICQYEPGPRRGPEPSEPFSVGPARGGGPAIPGGLLAASVVAGSRARSLVATLRQATLQAPTSALCPQGQVNARLALEVRLFEGARETAVFLTAGNCTVYGGNFADVNGIDIGSAVFPWTKQVCDDVIALPVVVPGRAGSWICSR